MSRLFRISKLGLFFGILIISSILTGCTKDNGDEVPYVYLNLNLDLSTDLSQLGVMETATITPDKNGLGVIRFSHPDYPEISLGLGQILNGNGLIIYRRDIYEYAVYDITPVHSRPKRIIAALNGMPIMKVSMIVHAAIPCSCTIQMDFMPYRDRRPCL